MGRDGQGPVARLHRLTRSYARAYARLGIAGSPRGLAVTATLRGLAEAPTLPEPRDAEALIPPVLSVHVRRVPGANLWIWYTADDATLTLHALTDAPP